MYNVSFPNLGFTFSINPVLLNFGNITIRWYGFFIALGFCLALIYVTRISKKFNINENKLINTVITGLILGIIGARLYYVVFYPGDQYIKNPISIFFINEGGLAIYGGIIFGIIGGVAAAKIQKLNVLAVLDLAALGFLIGQGIGRWGNFTNQEAFGVPTDLPWGMISENTGGAAVHPCFLYESLWCLLGFLFLHVFSKKYRKYDGEIFLIYIVWYGLERFFVEGLRTDSLYLFNTGIRISQLIAIIAVVIGIIFLVVLKHKKVKIKGMSSYGKNN